jgi:hypothetical protein
MLMEDDADLIFFSRKVWLASATSGLVELVNFEYPKTDPMGEIITDAKGCWFSSDKYYGKKGL